MEVVSVNSDDFIVVEAAIHPITGSAVDSVSLTPLGSFTTTDNIIFAYIKVKYFIRFFFRPLPHKL
jgi:hypothetical protein